MPTLRRRTAAHRLRLPLPQADLCGGYQTRPPPYHHRIGPLLYRASVSQLIAHFKYSGGLAYGRLFSRELLHRLYAEPKIIADLIVSTTQKNE